MNFGEALPEVVGLLTICALVAGVLFFLVRYWSRCQADTEYAQKRVTWPTTTVQATLFNASLKHFKDKPPGIVGQYKFKLDGRELTAEVYESFSGSSEERVAAVQALREEGKTIDLEVQYNPLNPSVVSTEIVKSVPKCRYFIGAAFLFFCVMELLVLRGLLRTTLAIFR